MGTFKPEYRIETLDQKVRNVNCVFDLFFGNTYHMPPPFFQKAILSGVSFGILMPVGSIYFECNAVIRQSKINRIASDPSFLLVGNRKGIKRKADLPRAFSP